MDDWFADTPEYTGPTTDEMDHTTPEDRNKCVILCARCHEWHHFERLPDVFLAADGQVCACGSTNFIGSTIVSERTWDPKRLPKFKRK